MFSCCAALLIQEDVEVSGLYAAAVPVFVSRQWSADVNLPSHLIKTISLSKKTLVWTSLLLNSTAYVDLNADQFSDNERLYKNRPCLYCKIFNRYRNWVPILSVQQISIVTDWVILPNKVSTAAGFLPFVEDGDPRMICADLCIRLWTLVNLNTHTIKAFEQLFIVNNTQMYLKLNCTQNKYISAPEKHSQELSIFTKAKL